ncbi:IS3 family transposase [Zooshikella ganghwensis]|uniref:IS3 family transposase n=1 Tax=Zooshikella ganghwensis TaxID=202772 RepID=A0A4P9VUZ6_9GAMM|nr:IS3 family transposase [Zooshikella ganghwensis]
MLNVHPSGFYAWLKQPESKRTQEDRTLVSKIKRAWIESGGMHGYRNIHQDLIDLKVKCGRDRVYRLMKAEGLKAQRSAKAPRPYYGGKPDTVAQNGLARDFNVDTPNQCWVSDITYVKTGEGFLYLAVVIDLFVRNVVGWSMSVRINEELVMNALSAAYWRRKPQSTVMFHSDQGSQYTSANFRSLLKDLNFEPSMSRRGNCWDNAVAESFFSNLKKECVPKKGFKTRDEARQVIFHYIEMFYNPIRRHTHNDRCSPANAEAAYFQNLETV